MKDSAELEKTYQMVIFCKLLEKRADPGDKPANPIAIPRERASRRTALVAFVSYVIATAIGCDDPNHRIALEKAKRYGGVRENAVNAVRVFINSQEAADDLIPHLKSLPDLAILSINGKKFTLSDSQLESIGQLEGLSSLSLVACNVDDAGLRHLAGLKNLSSLAVCFPPTPIQGHGLKHLSKMQKLRVLELTHTPISGPGLEHLSACENLRSLNLMHTNVDDNSIGYLLPLTQLKELDIRQTDITSSGALRLAALYNLDDAVAPNDLPDPNVSFKEYKEVSKAFYEEFIARKREFRRKAVGSGTN